MPERNPERLGLVIVRVWVEESAPDQVKARLTFTADLAGDTNAKTVRSASSSIDGITEIIKGWLEDFAASGPPPVTPR